MPTSSLFTRRSAIAQAKSAVRVPAAFKPVNARAVRPVAALPSDIAEFSSYDDLDVRGRTSARSIMDYQRSATKAVGSNGAATTPHDAVVLSVLQNYSGLTQDRLFNMLRNSGRFNESSSTLSSILNSLVSQGRVTNESGLFRFVTGGGKAASRSPSPAPSYTSRSASPVSRSAASSNGAGSGANAGDEAIVLSVLQNYSGLTEQRLSAMIRSSGKSVKSSVSSVLSGLVSQGKVENDRGTYRFLTKGASPRASSAPASRSATPSRAHSPAPSRGSAAPAGPGSGANAGDEATVLAVLQNYSGLTEQRLSSMIRSSGKSLKSSVSSVLSALVSQGKAQNDNGTYRFLTKGATPRPSSARSATPSRSYSPAPSRGSAAPAGPGSGANAGDEATVLAVLQNYSGLTEQRLSSMIRSSGKNLKGSVTSILSALVSQGKVQNDKGTYRFLTKGATPRPSSAPSPSRSYSPAPSRGSAAPAGPGTGANAGDEAVVLSVLQNYSGLTEQRLSSMIRNSGKNVKGSVSSVLSALVSQGKVQNDNGTYRFLTKGATPSGARTVSPTPSRTPVRAGTPGRSASRTATPSVGGRAASDDAVVLSILKNYSGLTEERLSGMLRNSGKSVSGSLRSVLDGLVRSGKVSFSGGVYRM